jgi:hypothetical protein
LLRSGLFNACPHAPSRAPVPADMTRRNIKMMRRTNRRRNVPFRARANVPGSPLYRTTLCFVFGLVNAA